MVFAETICCLAVVNASLNKVWLIVPQFSTPDTFYVIACCKPRIVPGVIFAMTLAPPGDTVSISQFTFHG